MLRWLFNIFALLSLLIFVATTVLFIRSFETSDFYNFLITSGNVGGLNSSDGAIEMTITTLDQATTPDFKLGQLQSVPTAFLTSSATSPSLLGLSIGDLKVGSGHMWYLQVSHLWVAFLFSICPMLWCVSVIRRRRTMHRSKNNKCVACGYDLQGSRGKCPECGEGLVTSV